MQIHKIRQGSILAPVLFLVILVFGYFVWQWFYFSGERRLDDTKESRIYFQIKNACVERERNLLKIPSEKTIEETFGLPVAKQIGEKCSNEANAEAERQTQ